MKKNIHDIIIHIFIFWIVTNIFTGITVKQEIIGYILTGGIYGIIMLSVVPLIKFFTFPFKFISILLISVLVSLIIFFMLNFFFPYVDFKDGTIWGFSKGIINLSSIKLTMMSNVFWGGFVSGILSALIVWLNKK